MAELITERITRNARELKLLGLAETADELIDRAEQAKLGYREFLDLVLETELGVVEGRRYASRLKLSALPNHKTAAPIRVAVLDDHAAVRAGLEAILGSAPGMVSVGSAHGEAELYWLPAAPVARSSVNPRPGGGRNRLHRGDTP